MIAGEEFERRLTVISQLRDFIVGLRHAAFEDYLKGKIPDKPKIDIRSDFEYWQRLADEKKGKIHAEKD